jgi:hypothetical protein
MSSWATYAVQQPRPAIRHNAGWSAEDASGGYVTPSGVVPGVHRVIAACWPRGARHHGRSSARASGVDIGRATHAKIARIITARLAGKRATPKPRSLVARFFAWLEREGLTPVAAELPVHEPGCAATQIDVLCRSARSPRAVVIEVKTTARSADEHRRTYLRDANAMTVRWTPELLGPNTEAAHHRYQLLATMRMFEQTYGVAWPNILGLVVCLPWNDGVFVYRHARHNSAAALPDSTRVAELLRIGCAQL